MTPLPALEANFRKLNPALWGFFHQLIHGDFMADNPKDLSAALKARQEVFELCIKVVPIAGDQIDWKDMYLKQKSEKEAMAAKYEKDIGPLEKVAPATDDHAPPRK